MEVKNDARRKTELMLQMMRRVDDEVLDVERRDQRRQSMLGLRSLIVFKCINVFTILTFMCLRD